MVTSTLIPRRLRRTAAARATGEYPLLVRYIKRLTPSRGNFGEDIADEDFRFTNTRRRSNSSSISHHFGDLKTKFDFNEPEPVFEESLHGPVDDDGEELSKTASSDSGRSSSV
jgi:hypothetical protein